jgi:hypothetical protein
MPHAIRPWSVAATLVAGCGNVFAPIVPSVKATVVDGQAIPGNWIVQTRTVAHQAMKGVTVVQTRNRGLWRHQQVPGRHRPEPRIGHDDGRPHLSGGRHLRDLQGSLAYRGSRQPQR